MIKFTINRLIFYDRYYSHNGQCNNLKHPLWGAENTPLPRILPAGPGDVSGSNRSARLDSLLVNQILGFSSERPTGFNNEMTTFAIQIMTHEIIRSKKVQVHKEKRGGGFKCCNPKNDSTLANLIKLNKYCIQIPVGKDNSCYGNQINCLSYVQSFKVLDNCTLSLNPSVLNWETSFLDCRLLYNNNSLQHMADNGGKVRTDDFEKLKEILVGYDERSMQFSALFLFLSYFYEFHNKVCDELKKNEIAKNLSPADFLKEVRKIVCATFQKILVELIASILREFFFTSN